MKKKMELRNIKYLMGLESNLFFPPWDPAGTVNYGKLSHHSESVPDPPVALPTL